MDLGKAVGAAGLALAASLGMFIFIGLLHVMMLIFGIDLPSTKVWFGACFVLSVVAIPFWLFIAFLHTLMTNADVENADFSSTGFLAIVFAILAALASALIIVLSESDKVFFRWLMSPACTSVTRFDYALYLLDNVLKGMIVDLFQSFSIDFYRCPPNKTVAVGSINFAIRSSVAALILCYAKLAYSRLYIAYIKNKKE